MDISPGVVNLPPSQTTATPVPKRSFFSPRAFFLLGGFLVLLVGLGVGVFLVQRQQSQNPQSKAAAAGKEGCSSMCSGNPPDCKGDVTIDINGNQPPACSYVTVAGMPSSMDAWAVVNPTYNQAVNCVARDSQKADCSCQVPNGGSYCWMGLESLVQNVGGQGHRWAAYVYDKTTNQLKSGGPTRWVLYDDNGSRVPRWGHGTFFGTEGVLHCGERNEYREQADIYGPGSWIETGQVIYAEPAGCGTTPPPGTASCQRVSADKDLATIKINDTVTFTGLGATSSESEPIDKINFIILKDSATLVSTESAAVRDTTSDAAVSGKAWKASFALKITEAGSYAVRIRAHWAKDDTWKE